MKIFEFMRDLHARPEMYLMDGPSSLTVVWEIETLLHGYTACLLQHWPHSPNPVRDFSAYAGQRLKQPSTFYFAHILTKAYGEVPLWEYFWALWFEFERERDDQHRA